MLGFLCWDFFFFQYLWLLSGLLYEKVVEKKKKKLLNVFGNQEQVKQQTELNGLNVFCIDAVAVQTFNPNHWNNQTLKLEELTVLHNAKIARLMKQTEEQAAKRLHVVMLDCWPVNFSAITKRHVLDKCPGMALIFLLVVLGVIKLTIQTSTNHAFKDCAYPF